MNDRERVAKKRLAGKNVQLMEPKYCLSHSNPPPKHVSATEMASEPLAERQSTP